VIVSFVPFVAVALVAFAPLILIIMRHMRHTVAAIADGERQLRHLALHDPVCGLPNRIYFSERLERAIAEVRNGGPSAAPTSICSCAPPACIQCKATASAGQ
jgi:diguanylate cyclase